MSGAEAVIGLVLGVLPLLVSTTEHYDDVFRPFRRFKRFSKELKQFQQEFLGHKTVFHNECLLLLSTFTGVEVANEMLREKDHSLRKDLDLNKKLSDQLGASREACYAIISLITEELDSIHRESQRFEVAISDEVSSTSNRYRAWRQKIGAKLKFCISEGRLDRCLKRLKDYNRVFGRLSSQTKELNNCQKITDLPPSTPRSDQRRLKECTLVRDAAIQLYNALVESCATHPEHSAHIRLSSQYQVECSPPLIRFDMAFAQDLLQGRSYDADTAWFAIESIFNETLMKESDIKPEAKEAKETWCNFRTTLKRAIKDGSPPPILAKKLKQDKTVRFLSPPLNVNNHISMPPPKLPPQIPIKGFLDSSLPNFCVGRDFCSQVRRCSKRARSSSDACIGYLQRTGTYSHRVYYKQPQEHCESNAVVTLAQIFTSISAAEPSQKHSNRMLQYQSLRLARQLASAVLQFHATPILTESWRSKDVVFYWQDNVSVLQPQRLDMKIPYLNVKVRTSLGNTAAIQQTSAMINTNPYTFSLGIILLEIAYQAPFQDLCLLESNSSISLEPLLPQFPPSSSLSTSTQTISQTLLTPNFLNDFSIATQLSYNLSAELGVRYARMVRKCLSCDFGQGTRDLKDEGLQEAFYQDVVCELERLENRFAELQLGDSSS